MSLQTTYDSQTEPVLKAAYLAVPGERVPETLIVTFSSEILRTAAAMPGAELATTIKPEFLPTPVYHLPIDNAEIGIYQTQIGGPASVMLLEDCVALGAKRFLFFGSCGALEASVSGGHLLIPTAAYRDEGTSYHYLPATDWLQLPSAEALCQVLQELQVPFTRVKTWTTDALYRETTGNCSRRRDIGCQVVEMECASIMACAQALGVDCWQFLYGDDSLDGDSWDAGGWNNHADGQMAQYLRIALKAAERLSHR